MNRLRNVLLSLLLAAVSVVLTAPSNPARAGKETRVTAEQLAQDYSNNPATFNKQYKGKVVVVEGTVELADAVDARKQHWLMLKGYQKKGNPVPTMVRCQYVPEFKGLKEGQKVTVQGTCQGHSDTVFAAELVDCKLVSKSEKK
jgi:hypothetical protein